MNHRRVRSLLTITLPLIAGVLAGCSAAPTVELRKISSPSDITGDEFDSYYLQKSRIKIDETGTTKTADGKKRDELSIQSIPTENITFKIGITRADKLGVKTNLILTKFENTDLLKEAGVEIVDKRVELIGKIGTIVAAVAAIPFEKEAILTAGALPKIIETSVLINKNKIGRDKSAEIDAADGVSVTFGPIPPDARSIDKFVSPNTMSGLIYAACRTATVKFKYQDYNYKRDVKVSDPNFFEVASFPLKGKIKFHSECGASITSDQDTGVSGSADIVDALAAQAKAIKDAIDAAKKENK